MKSKILDIFASHNEKLISKELKRGEILYHMGDDPKGFYLIQSGLMGLFHIAPNGKESFFRIFAKDNILGHRSYFAEVSYHASAVCLQTCKISFLAKEYIDEHFKNHPEDLRPILKRIALDLGNAEIRIAGLKDKTAISRISETLIFLKLKHPNYSWTRKEIAEFSGTTVESVARAMTQLAELGLIEKEGRDFHILDQNKMMDYISEQD
ncbi:MAG: Crp/Fnr family transcriptional regulator [Bdellovibrionota bacterium]|nr:Crp/Fnr family transcriptional regulator [Bdellovibrionota bacterium]